MVEFFSKLLDNLSEYLAERKGLLPLLGLVLILVNLAIRIIFPEGYLARTDLILHIGLLIAIIGFLLARAL
jgi:hypothetical protein